MDNVPQKDVTIVIGDWNAKRGKAAFKTNDIGIHGLRIRNERGDKLEKFRVTNNLVIGNTTFQHHPRRL